MNISPSSASPVIEELRRQFERLWIDGVQPEISASLPDKTDPRYLATLEELVHIDLEFRWKCDTTTQDDQTRVFNGSIVEHYVDRFPELTDSSVLLRLLQTEYVVRNRFGDRPMWQNYQTRYPDIVTSAEQLVESHIESVCDTKFEHPEESALELPALIGRYELIGVLGRGAFGRVYRGIDTRLQRDVAVKVSHAHKVSDFKEITNYLAEARRLAKLDHPAIVPVYDADQTADGTCYVVSKLIEGANLAEYFRESSLGIDDAVRITMNLAEALHASHQRGLIHRDVKPANILIGEDGRTYITDFGLALHNDDYATGPKFLGTPAYMSPEQARGEGHRVDARSDVYSLAVVFYEMLTSQVPFEARSTTELLEKVKTAPISSPSAINENVPLELERICLRALSKRASDRFGSALNFADELRAWTSAQKSSSRSSDTSSATGDNSTSYVEIVPKGLRCFDEDDAGFFLDLVPGPVSRDGIPETLCFWKERIAGVDSERFAVGVIYGPSGSGKSSFVRAGLLPLVDDRVDVVYLEATPDQLENQLAVALGCEPSDAAQNLSATMCELRVNREGRRPKLIVLDQFEQWLQGNAHQLEGELAAALRHCDGSNIQCLLLIRDDFWMSLVRFMRLLEVPIEEGRNALAVDLFDRDHARAVLFRFGQYYGKVPIRQSEVSPDHRQFIDDAIDGLSTDNAVIPVRLSLFAEMIKTRDWLPGTLLEVGGADGVGVEFLERMFGDGRSSRYPRHAVAVEAVLKSLLSDSGSNIKGVMKTASDISLATGHPVSSKKFELLINILDHELRIITPCDRSGQQLGAQSSVAERYQLAHDYLVPSVREWLRRRQSSTVRGRTAIQSAERARFWALRPEPRQLPSLGEWLRIRSLVSSRRWSAPERRMMKAADRHHGLRSFGVISALVLIALVVTMWRNQSRGDAVYQRLMASDASEFSRTLTEFTPYIASYEHQLRAIVTDANGERRQKLYARLALLPLDSSQKMPLLDRELSCAPDELALLLEQLEPYKRELADTVWHRMSNEKIPADQMLHAFLLLAQYDSQLDRWDDDVVNKLVESLVNSNPDYHRMYRGYLRDISGHLYENLHGVLVNQDRRESVRTAAANALADLAQDQWQVLLEATLVSNPECFQILFDSLSSLDRREGVLLSMDNLLDQQPGEKLSHLERIKLGRKRAVASIVRARWGDSLGMTRALDVQNDPESHCQFVTRAHDYGIPAIALIDELHEADDSQVIYGLLAALSLYQLDDIPDSNRLSIQERIEDLFRTHDSSSVHSVSRLLMHRWGMEELVEEIESVDVPYDANSTRQWYRINIGKYPLTFIIFEPGIYERGWSESEEPGTEAELSHIVRLTRRIGVLDREVSRGLFNAFWTRKLDGFVNIEPFSPTFAHPAVGANWNEAVLFCRWLSSEAGYDAGDQCYELPDSEIPGSEYWPLHLDRSSFRLLTEAEWEYACRSGTITTFGFGSDRSLTSFYGVVRQDSVKSTMPCGSKIPTLRGLHDMHGNAMEWVHDWYTAYKTEYFELDDPVDENPGAGRVIRGGSYGTGDWRCAYRNNIQPDNRGGFLGFRIVQTLN